MASRAMTPLSRASRNVSLKSIPRASRAFGSSRTAWEDSAAAPPSTSTTTPSKPPYSSPKPATASKSYSKPTSKPAPASPPPRTRLPAVSGQPLPDVSPAADISTGNPTGDPIDWTQSFHGIGTSQFSPEAANILLAPIDPMDVEVKPDGILYLPEIKYRRILNRAFGPGGWGLAPRGDLIVEAKTKKVARDYALVVHGRFVAQARGEQQYFNDDGISTAAEGCKSNALMRCTKDLGVASELWDPRFIRKFVKEQAKQVWAEVITTGKKRMVWMRKDDELRYPYKKTT
ncbi:mitochondrial genome maintenance MGM101-domain-containing protein [Xylariaceae sp. FL1272]|nr:mitochondrial genome maintenance MGM101-domain-containing protein [Xylariaceae sp. FL1272]